MNCDRLPPLHLAVQVHGIVDPSGNAPGFKGLRDPGRLFAKHGS